MKEAILIAKVALAVLTLTVKAVEALDDAPWDGWWS